MIEIKYTSVPFKRSLYVILLSVILAGCNKRRPAGDFTSLFTDDFNRADQTLSATANWIVSASGGTFGVVSNQALPIAGGVVSPSAFAFTQSTEKDVLIEVDITISGGNVVNPVAMILARYDTNNVTTATSGYQCGLSGNNTLVLKKNGAVVASGSKTITTNSGNTYQLTFGQESYLVSCTITGTVDDIASVVETTLLTGTNHGLIGGVFSYNYMYFDNFYLGGRGKN